MLTWRADVTLGADLGVAGGYGDIYAAMGWLASRQDSIEAKLAARHLAGVGEVHFKLAVGLPLGGWLAGLSSWAVRDLRRRLGRLSVAAAPFRATVPIG
jgi:hypothetical protein